MKQETRKRVIEIADQSDDMSDFAKKGCEEGIFISMAEGRRVWHSRDAIRRNIIRAEEKL